jgi:hypothetical protein
MFRQLKLTLKSTIVSVIELCCREESTHQWNFRAGESKAPAPPLFHSLNFHSNSSKCQGTNWLFNVPTSQTDIEECHSLRHRILLQGELNWFARLLTWVERVAKGSVIVGLFLVFFAGFSHLQQKADEKKRYEVLKIDKKGSTCPTLK